MHVNVYCMHDDVLFDDVRRQCAVYPRACGTEEEVYRVSSFSAGIINARGMKKLN